MRWSREIKKPPVTDKNECQGRINSAVPPCFTVDHKPVRLSDTENHSISPAANAGITSWNTGRRNFSVDHALTGPFNRLHLGPASIFPGLSVRASAVFISESSVFLLLMYLLYAFCRKMSTPSIKVHTFLTRGAPVGIARIVWMHLR